MGVACDWAMFSSSGPWDDREVLVEVGYPQTITTRQSSTSLQFMLLDLII